MHSPESSDSAVLWAGSKFDALSDEENGNITFRYQMLSFLFVKNDEDQSFFQLILPAIFDVTEDNYTQVLKAVNEVNLGMKVVKVSVVGNSVWLFLESLLDHTPDISDIMPRALQILQNAQQRFYQEYHQI